MLWDHKAFMMALVTMGCQLMLLLSSIKMKGDFHFSWIRRNLTIDQVELNLKHLLLQNRLRHQSLIYFRILSRTGTFDAPTTVSA